MPAEAFHSLEDYERCKLALAGHVSALLRWSERHQAPRAAACRALLARLAEDRFQLALMGECSRGKSSLMNALLGAALLPVGALPVTSALTGVRYGDRERALLYWPDSALPQMIAVADLPRYITQAGNPGNRRQLTRAEVQFPHELLRLGVEFIDTPGTGSADTANTQTTYAFLPQADAAIFVTSAEAPLSRTELEFLGDIRAQARHVTVVVNKLDLVEEAERPALRTDVQERLERRWPGATPALFLLSARDALRARQAGDERALAASGLPELEAALVRYLREDKMLDFLARCTQTALTLSGDALTSEPAFAAGAGQERRPGADRLLAAAEAELHRIVFPQQELARALEQALAADLSASPSWPERIGTSARLSLEPMQQRIAAALLAAGAPPELRLPQPGDLATAFVAQVGSEPPWWFDMPLPAKVRQQRARAWAGRAASCEALVRGILLDQIRAVIGAWAASSAPTETASAPLPPLTSAARADLKGIREELVQFQASLENPSAALPAWRAPADPQAANFHCLLCERSQRAVWDGLSELQYALYTDPAARRQHAARFGFCRVHSWQYASLASPQGICAAYADVLESGAGQLREWAGLAPDAVDARLCALTPAAAVCPACQWAADSAAIAARELAQRTPVPVVCLFHMPLLLRAAPPEAVSDLIQAEADVLERESRQMRLYALKHDARRRQLTSAAERRAAQSGLDLLVGRRSLASLPEERL